MKLKRWAAGFLALFMVLALAACGGEAATQGGDTSAADAGPDAAAAPAEDAKDGFVIGFLNNYVGNTWRGQYVENIEAVCEAYKQQGILKDYTVASCNDDVTTQLNQINQMLSEGVDALVINPVSPTAISSVVERAKEEGILVVIANDAAAYEGTYCVGNSQDAYARIGMEWMVDKMNQMGLSNLIFFEGLAGNATEVSRNNAAQEVLAANPQINVLATAPNSWSMTETQAAMATFLSAYNNIEAVYGPEGIEGVYRAYENAGSDLPLMNADYTYSSLQYWKDNGMDSTVTPSSPYIGANAVKIAVRLLMGEELDTSKFQPNPLDESIVNYIELDPPYTVVTTEADKSLAIFQRYEGMALLTIDEALALCEGQPSTYMLDMPATDDYLSTFFK